MYQVTQDWQGTRGQNN